MDMKKRFVLLSLLATLSLSGCDSFSNIFSIKSKDNNSSTQNNEEKSSEQSSLVTFTQEDDETIEEDTTQTTTITVTGDDADRINEYYQNISASATGISLRTALCTLTKQNHQKYGYGSLEIAMKTTDRNWEKSPDPNDENPYMYLLYTVNNDTKASKWNTYHGKGGIEDYNSAHWNKEHIWAKSNGFSSEGADAYSDLHHLRASDTKNNGSRSSFAFNNNSGSYVQDFNGDNSGKLGGSPKVYEPIDRDKGDVARALFYMATRYMDGVGSTGTHLTLTNGTESSGGKWGYLSTLLAWHTQDPPDAFEKHRNSLVQDIQGNRNPYIDHPEWAQKVFG